MASVLAGTGKLFEALLIGFPRPTTTMAGSDAGSRGNEIGCQSIGNRLATAWQFRTYPPARRVTPEGQPVATRLPKTVCFPCFSVFLVDSC